MGVYIERSSTSKVAFAGILQSVNNDGSIDVVDKEGRFSFDLGMLDEFVGKEIKLTVTNKEVE